MSPALTVVIPGRVQRDPRTQGHLLELPLDPQVKPKGDSLLGGAR